MRNKLIIDGNSFYEVDEECLRRISMNLPCENSGNDDISKKEFRNPNRGSSPSFSRYYE